MTGSAPYQFDFLDEMQWRKVLSARVAASLPPQGVRVFTVTDDAFDTEASAAKYGSWSPC